MLRMPFLIAAMVAASGFTWTIHLIVAPAPWAEDAALAIAIGIVVLSIVAMTALLLGRGRWTRYFAGGLLLAELLIVVVADVDGWLIVATVLSGLTLAGLGGPWLRGWLRERPAAGAPGPRPLILAIGSFAVVPLVGLAAPDGLRPAHGVAGALGILLSWGYARGTVWALWGLRLGMPPVLVAAALSSPVGGVVLLLAAAAALTALAWSKEARLAVDPLRGQLPAPRPRKA